ncbi:hypothetical protein [Fodinibius roseus]|nr:hypothetical protein [Fodinibius roseus]
MGKANPLQCYRPSPHRHDSVHAEPALSMAKVVNRRWSAVTFISA